MYWTKIATTEYEFDQIAALNYETFVEEIPQHQQNHTHRLVDRFHHENTYIVVYKETELVGMIAFRAVRPFSLDEKLGLSNSIYPKSIVRIFVSYDFWQ